MNINSINQTMNFYGSIQSRNIATSQKNSSVSHYSMNCCDILNNYNCATINFRGKNPLEKLLCYWVEKNDINNKTIRSFEHIFEAQKDNKPLIKKIKSVTPRIVATDFPLQHFPESPNGVLYQVSQTAQLNKKGKSVGTYSVYYDLDGRILDDYLALK